MAWDLEPTAEPSSNVSVTRWCEEYALLHLLAVAYRRQAELPPPLRESVRSRVGFSLRQADVLAGGQPVRDHWQVLARRDLEQDRIRTRRTCCAAARPAGTRWCSASRPPATRPASTIFILISDLYEGGDRGEMLRRIADMTTSGTQVIALLALSDDGAPGYDHENAAALAGLGVSAFACAPDTFPT